jgi:ABC-2 type transport system permease protein
VISLRRLRVLLAHEMRVNSRDPLPLLVMVVFPVITMAFLKPAFQPALVQAGHAGANGAEHVVPGQAVVGAFFVVSLVSFGFFSEHSMKTWDRLRASPASSLEVVLGKALPRVVLGIAQFVVIFAAGVLLFGLDIRGSAWTLIPIVVALALSLALLGVAVTAVCRTAQQANSFAIVGMVLFGAIGGALVPFDVLPDWAQILAPVTPTYWAMDGFNAVILDGEGIGAVAAPVGALLGMTALFTVIALRRLRFDEQKIGWA